jgi:hypothetical protein
MFWQVTNPLVATKPYAGMLCIMRLRILPLVTGLLPIVAIHASLFLAINAGVIPACIPYFEGCASISATGRYEPAVFVFKPVMTVEAALLILYWLASAAWISRLCELTNQRGRAAPFVMLAFGVISAVALIIYVAFLGTQAPFYEFMRRFGIYFYFLFSVLAQIMLAHHSLRLAQQLNLPLLAKISRTQFWLAVTPFILGVLNLVLKAILDDADAAENGIEWLAALMMQVYFVLSYYAWTDTRFEIDLTINPRKRL